MFRFEPAQGTPVPLLHTTFPIAMYCGNAGRLTFWHCAPTNNTNLLSYHQQALMKIIFFCFRPDKKYDEVS